MMLWNLRSMRQRAYTETPYIMQHHSTYATSLVISRSLNFWILPVDVFGSSVKTT
jgi:hypothetical protein